MPLPVWMVLTMIVFGTVAGATITEDRPVPVVTTMAVTAALWLSFVASSPLIDGG